MRRVKKEPSSRPKPDREAGQGGRRGGGQRRAPAPVQLDLQISGPRPSSAEPTRPAPAAAAAPSGPVVSAAAAAAFLAAAGGAADDRNPVLIYLQGLAVGSRRHIRSSLAIVARLLVGKDGAEVEQFPWALVRREHVQALRTALAETYAPSSANRHLAAVRGVLRECWRLQLIDGDSYQHVVAVQPVPQADQREAGRDLSKADLRALLEACGQGAAGSRDAALVGLLYGCGLKRSEVCALRLEDYDARAGDLQVGSRRKLQRAVYPPIGARAAISAWLKFRGDEPGPLLMPVRKDGSIVPRELGPDGVFALLRRLAERAELAGCSPRDLRRSFLGELFEQGADVVSVRDLAGHATIEMAARYDRRAERGKRRAVELLEVPFERQPRRRR